MSAVRLPSLTVAVAQWVMPQRFLDQQLPLAQIDTAKRDVPPENYCNASLYICDNIYSGLPCEPRTSASPRSCGLLSASGLGTESRPQDVPNPLPGSLSGGVLGQQGSRRTSRSSRTTDGSTARPSAGRTSMRAAS